MDCFQCADEVIESRSVGGISGWILPRFPLMPSVWLAVTGESQGYDNSPTLFPYR